MPNAGYQGSPPWRWPWRIGGAGVTAVVSAPLFTLSVWASLYERTPAVAHRALRNVPIFVELLQLLAHFVVILSAHYHLLQALPVREFRLVHGVFFVVPGAFVGLVV